MFFSPGVDKPSDQVLLSVYKGELPWNEVKELHRAAIAHHRKQIKEFIVGILLLTIMYFVLMSNSISEMGAGAAILPLLGTGAALILVMAGIKYFYVDAVKRKFLRAVRIGYPNFSLE